MESDQFCLPATSRLVAPPVKLMVVRTTKRDGELVADAATEGARLGKAQMVRIGRPTTAHEARFARDKSPMLLVAQSDAFLEDRSAFVV
jgi:hypothetical protein